MKLLRPLVAVLALLIMSTHVIVAHKVAVFGGGLSGMTAALELAEAGVSVELHEASDRLGGKAVGYHNASGYPLEHSMRIITRGYLAMFDVMERIPARGGGGKSDEGNALDHNLTPLDVAEMVSGKHTRGAVRMHVHVTESEAAVLQAVGNALGAGADVAAKTTKAASALEHAVAALATSSGTGFTGGMDGRRSAGLAAEEVLVEASTAMRSTATAALSTVAGEAVHYASLLPFGVFNPAPWVWDVRPNELVPFFNKILRYAEADRNGRHAMAANKSFADAIGFDDMSAEMQNYVTRFSGIVVAGRPRSSAHSMFNVWYHFMMGFPTTERFSAWNKSKAFMFNGPTSERLIDPLAARLIELGVKVHLNSRLVALDGHGSAKQHKDNEHHGGKADTTSSATALGTPLLQRQPRRVRAHVAGMKGAVEADAAVLAIPLRALRAATGESILGPEFGTGNEWSVGFQFYILGEVPATLTRGRSVAMVMDSEWQLVYVVQRPGEGDLWDQTVTLPQGVTAVLSVTLSDVTAAGVTHGSKTFWQSTPEEAAEEILVQLGLDTVAVSALAWTGRPGPGVRYIDDEELETFKVEGGVEIGPMQPNGKRWVALWPLFIPLPGCALVEPTVAAETKPGREGVFLAGEIVNTPWFQVPTMEKAIESGKLAAQAVLDSLLGEDVHRVPGLDFPSDWRW